MESYDKDSYSLNKFVAFNEGCTHVVTLPLPQWKRSFYTCLRRPWLFSKEMIMLYFKLWNEQFPEAPLNQRLLGVRGELSAVHSLEAPLKHSLHGLLEFPSWIKHQLNTGVTSSVDHFFMRSPPLPNLLPCFLTYAFGNHSPQRLNTCLFLGLL